MGESKRRGTKDQRIKQALEKHRPISTEQVKKELGVPDSAEFVGYVVHKVDTDEFLHLMSGDPDYAAHYAWARTPELAHRYTDFHQAKLVVDDYGKDSVVALLFDHENQLMVGYSE